jgi:hypothetical protein
VLGPCTNDTDTVSRVDAGIDHRRSTLVRDLQHAAALSSASEMTLIPALLLTCTVSFVAFAPIDANTALPLPTVTRLVPSADTPRAADGDCEAEL